MCTVSSAFIYSVSTVSPGFVFSSEFGNSVSLVNPVNSVSTISPGFVFILCTISLAISYVSYLFCAHLRAVPINFNCNDENRILGK